MIAEYLAQSSPCPRCGRTYPVQFDTHTGTVWPFHICVVRESWDEDGR